MRKRTFETVPVSLLRCGDLVKDGEDGLVDSISALRMDKDGIYILWRSIDQLGGEYMGPYNLKEPMLRVKVERMNAA
jgi:hypothetical protein